MDIRRFYNEVVTDHNMHPLHKHPIENPDYDLAGVNPSCGDEIAVQIKVKDGVITDASFSGDGCAVSQSSADIMVDMIIGKTISEAKHLSELFIKMIKGSVSESELGELREAGALADVSHMPARVKCAVLGWHTLEEIIKAIESNS